MNETIAINCTALATRSSFYLYVQTLKNETGNNSTLLGMCKPEICNALWGTGNADISGIGMIFGYIFESLLGFSFALGLEVIRSTTPARGVDFRWRKFRAVVLRGCSVFFDCAIYFAASTQIACVVVLVRKDYGMSADGEGGLTMQITWAVALLSLLPLLYPRVMLSVFVKKLKGPEELEDAETSWSRHEFRFYLFCACWYLFLYPFVSWMIGDYASSQIGVGKGGGGTTIITDNEYDTLTSLCFTGIQPLTAGETMVIEAFGTAGSILLSLFVFCPFIGDVTRSLIPEHVKWAKERFSTQRIKWAVSSLGPRVMLVSVPLLTIPQIWGVFRIRNIQLALLEAVGDEYSDNQWTFRKVVAVIIFAPVLVEMVYLYVQR